MKKADSATKRSATISLADEEQVKDVLANAVLGLWDVVNSMTRLRPSRRERYRVTIFGSARVKPGTFGYEATKRCAAELAKLGCDIITGGGPIGLMQVATMKELPALQTGQNPSAFASICHSSRKSIRSSVRRSSIARSSRDCIEVSY